MIEGCGGRLRGANEGQLTRRKWNWLQQTLRSDDHIAKQALQWSLQGCRKRQQSTNTWKRDLEKEMWMAGFSYSWNM